MNVRDADFLCVCGGTYMPDESCNRHGLKGFRCDTCGRTGPLGCPVCHKPRGIFVRNFEQCAFCEGSFAALTEIFREMINPG